MKRYICLLMAILFLASCGPVRQDRTFQDREAVCFVGDSITQIGRYHYIISLFYHTRYPDREIIFQNLGIGGDIAPGVHYRFERVVDRRPTSMTLMLGMNDSGYEHYLLEDETEKDRVTKEKYELFCNSMDSIADKLNNELPDTNVTLIGSSMYDETSKEERISSIGKNTTIIKMSKRCQQLALDNGYGFVDFNAPMLRITAEQQLKDPLFTLCPARVHPEWNGDTVMAYTFLKYQGVNGVVSSIEIDAERSKIIEMKNCRLSDLKVDPDKVAFKLKSNSLPFPMLEKGYRDKTFIAALELVPFEKELNQEIVKVTGLEGQYKLLIDGNEVGGYSANELSKGVNLAFNNLTPQYKQAEKVLAMHEDKTNKEHVERDIAWIYHKLIDGKGLNRGSDKKDLISVVEEAKPRYKEYQRRIADQFLNNFEKEDELIEEVKAIQRQIYKINKPLEHNYVLQKIK